MRPDAYTPSFYFPNAAPAILASLSQLYPDSMKIKNRNVLSRTIRLLLKITGTKNGTITLVIK